MVVKPFNLQRSRRNRLHHFVAEKKAKELVTRKGEEARKGPLKKMYDKVRRKCSMYGNMFSAVSTSLATLQNNKKLP